MNPSLFPLDSLRTSGDPNRRCAGLARGPRPPAVPRAAAWAVVLAGAAGLAVSAGPFVEMVVPGWTNITATPLISAWMDYDGDGDLDAYVPRSAGLTGGATNLFFRNDGASGFTALSVEEVGDPVADRDLSIGASWGDVNHDGLPDLLVVNNITGFGGAPVAARLYLQQPGGRFRSIDAGALTRLHHTFGWGHWADFDRDGNLDAFLCTADATATHRTNVLVRGLGDGTFVYVTGDPVATDVISAGFANDSLWTDFNGDGSPDLLVSNPGSRDMVYRNLGGRFQRMTQSVLERTAGGSHRYTPADLDNDGDVDLIWGTLTSRLYFNDGLGGFTARQTIPRATAQVGDFDNDGDVDLLFSGDNEAQRSQLWINDGTGHFTVGTGVFPEAESWVGGPWVDIDDDGFLDQFMQKPGGSGGRAHVLFRNQGNGNHWLKVRLVGTASNRTALGAKVRVRATWNGGTRWQVREITSYVNAPDALRAHFGLGGASRAEVVRVEWPSGTVQELTDVAGDRVLTITEPDPIRLGVAGQGNEVELTCRSTPGVLLDLERSGDLRTWERIGQATTGADGVARALFPANGGAGAFRAVRR